MKPFLIFCFVFFSLFSFAQDKPSKNEKASFEVLGNCGMCKDRIEKAAIFCERSEVCLLGHSFRSASFGVQWFENQPRCDRNADCWLWTRYRKS